MVVNLEFCLDRQIFCKFSYYQYGWIMSTLVKKISPVILLVLLFTMFLVPRNALAFSFDFSGTVLFDSKASNYCLPGFGHNFKGALSVGDDLLTFENNNKPTFYEDFGIVTGGYFSQEGSDFFYAFSQGDDASSQMGMIWWSDPRNFTIGQHFFDNVYGLVFYLEGSTLYTPAQMIAWRLADYFATGYLPTLTGGGSNLHYLGCRIADGTAFLGLIETPFVAEQSSNSAVPLPASVWFLGSGLLLLVRRRKR